MKLRLLSTLFSFLLMVTVFAQEANLDHIPAGQAGNNELKINLLYIVLETIELDYERIINPDFGVGMAANIWVEEFSELNYMVIPYFRFYPSESRRASGFFLEGSMGIVGYNEYSYDFNNGFFFGKEERRVAVGGGVAVGGKFISRSGFFGEVFGGLGRLFGTDGWVEVYPRAGINFGKRF